MPKNITREQQSAAQSIQNEILQKQEIFANFKAGLFQNVDFGIFSDIAYCFMDASGTETAKQKNLQLLELLAAKSGQADFTARAMNSIFNLL